MLSVQRMLLAAAVSSAVTRTTALSAQEPQDTATLPAIVVTATRVASPAVTASTTVIAGPELRALGITHVADVLALVPGAAVVQTGSFGGKTSLFLRGGESGYTRVLLDGVPLNQPGGAFDFSALTTAAVDRIEIVRGPASVLYGSDAVAGVVQIFTQRGTGPARTSLDVMGGNYGTVSLITGQTGGTPTASYGLHLSRYQTRGIYAFNNDYHDTQLAGAVRLLPDPQSDATITFHYSDDVYHVPTDGTGRLIDHNAFQFARWYAVGVDAGRHLSSAAEVRLQLSTYTTDGGFDNRPDGPADTLGFYADRSLETIERRSADTRLNLYTPWGGIVTIGGQVEEERERSLDESQSQFGPSNSLFDEDRRNVAAYGQMVGSLGRVAWNASVRGDRNQTFGSFGTFRAGAAIRLAAGLRVRSSIGTAFREPTFFENFAAGFVKGNPNLSPERTTSWEVGMEQSLPGAAGSVSAVWFNQQFRNLIDFTFSPPAVGDPNYFNVAAARARGLELTLTARARGGVSVRGQYTFLDTRVLDPGFDSTAFGLFQRDSALIRRPAHSGNVSVGYGYRDRFGVRLGLNYVGSREDVDYRNAIRTVLPAYTTVEMSADYTPVRRDGRSVALRLRIGNLLDRAYQSVKGFAAPGRTVLGGAVVEF